MKILLFDSYLSIIKKSVNARIFQSLYFTDGKRKIDILKKGDLSCAFFVSCVLKLFNLISSPHTTVKSTVSDLLAHHWQKVKKPKIGAILHWEDKNGHEHLGFYIGNQKAISNSSKKRVPIIHHWTYKNKRKIIAIYWHKGLERNIK